MSELHNRLAHLSQKVQHLALHMPEFGRQQVDLVLFTALSRIGSLINSRSMLVRCPPCVLQSIAAEDGGTALACVCRKIRHDLLGVVDMMWRHMNLRGMSTRECYARIGATGRLRIHVHARDKNVRRLTRLVLDASVLAQLERLDIYISPDYRQLFRVIGNRSMPPIKYPRFELLVPGSTDDPPPAVAAAPFLSRLSIDLGPSRWRPDLYIEDSLRRSSGMSEMLSQQMSWSVPPALFAAGSALHTLLIRGIGFPSADLMACTLVNLASFTYHGPATVYSNQIDTLLVLAVRLRSLSIRCHEFVDNSTAALDSNLAGHVENIIAGQRYTDVGAGDASILWYFWNRGARDMAVWLGPQDLTSDQPNAIFPSDVCRIACSDGGISLHCEDVSMDVDTGVQERAATRRMRFMADDISDASNLFLDSLQSIDQNLLTSLSLHEYPFVNLFHGIPDPAGMHGLPAQFGMPPQLASLMQTGGHNPAALGFAPAPAQPPALARPFLFPNVTQLTVWLATCAEHRNSLRAFTVMPGSHQTFASIFSLWRLYEAEDAHITLDQCCAPPQMPRLTKFELSSMAMVGERLRDYWCHEFKHVSMRRREPRFSESEEEHNRLRLRWCSCPHGACVAVCDVHDFLLRHGYATQSLSVRLSGINLVDVNLYQAVLALQSDVGMVEVHEHPASCEVCQTADFELLDATATFQQLDGGV